MWLTMSLNTDYTDWLHFFQHEIEHHGSWQKVLAEYMFKEDDARSEDMQVRMFAGFVHPLIQLSKFPLIAIPSLRTRLHLFKNRNPQRQMLIVPT